MSRTRILDAVPAGVAAVVLATAAFLGSLAVAHAAAPTATATTTTAAKATTIDLRRTSLGPVLVNSRGFTLYAFSRDSAGKDHCVSTGGCTSAWPIVVTHGKPRAGHGVKRSLLGTITVRGGITQVTYAGHPLYTYVADSSGSTAYVGVSQFGGVWRAVKASGQPTG